MSVKVEKLLMGRTLKGTYFGGKMIFPLLCVAFSIQLIFHINCFRFIALAFQALNSKLSGKKSANRFIKRC